MTHTSSLHGILRPSRFKPAVTFRPQTAVYSKQQHLRIRSRLFTSTPTGETRPQHSPHWILQQWTLRGCPRFRHSSHRYLDRTSPLVGTAVRSGSSYTGDACTSTARRPKTGEEGEEDAELVVVFQESLGWSHPRPRVQPTHPRAASRRSYRAIIEDASEIEEASKREAAAPDEHRPSPPPTRERETSTTTRTPPTQLYYPPCASLPGRFLATKQQPPPALSRYTLPAHHRRLLSSA